KKRFDADVCATNNVFQGSELTKEDRESQLYDEFERFKMLPGENINECYETDIRQKDEKSSKNGQNRARNGKAWKS
ncbi:hypothetical protein Tco_1049279, partial [Tanacetum coccineum]